MKYLGVILLMFLFSCHNTVEKENSFKIILNIKVKESDIFQVFYTTKASEKYTNNRMIVKVIDNELTFNKVQFNIPNNIIPKKIRIDLGEKQKANKITIKEIVFVNNNKRFVINKSMIKYFFKPNIYLCYSAKKNIFTTKIVNGKYDPFLTPTPLLEKKIELEY